MTRINRLCVLIRTACLFTICQHLHAIMTSQIAFYVNLHRAVIGPSATLTGQWRPDIDLRRMLTGLANILNVYDVQCEKSVLKGNGYTFRGGNYIKIVLSPSENRSTLWEKNLETFPKRANVFIIELTPFQREQILSLQSWPFFGVQQSKQEFTKAVSLVIKWQLDLKENLFT